MRNERWEDSHTVSPCVFVKAAGFQPSCELGKLGQMQILKGIKESEKRREQIGYKRQLEAKMHERTIKKGNTTRLIIYIMRKINV